MRRVAAVALGLLIAFAIAEGAFRVHEARQRRRVARTEVWAVADPVLGYRNNPAFGDHDALGLRGGPDGPKGARPRLLVLGDSVSYYGDDAGDTFPGRLERDLAAAGREVEVINAAVRGYTTHQELEWLKQRGLGLEPDAVCLAFVLNDLHRFLHAFRIEDGRIVGMDYELTDEAIGSVDSLLYRVLRKSHLLVWLRHHLSLNDPTAALGGSEAFSFEYRPDFRTAWLEERWETVDAQLAELVELGARNGFEPFVVVFPFGEQYREDYLARDREHVLFPQRRLAALCAARNVPLLDLYQLLDPALDLEEDGIHLTPRGRERAAELVADFALRIDVLPARPHPVEDDG